MTTYNTGNPIGSTDARDRSDNSENLDLAVNSLSQTFVDRLGVTRDTLEGIYQKSAYYRAGTFDAGYTLTNNRQTLAYGNVEYSWSGAFPKVVSAGSTPATSGGIGAGAWVDRTDITLRYELAETVFQDMKRYYATSGYTLVSGSFQDGGEVTGFGDVLWDKTTGKAYQWHLNESKTVPAGSSIDSNWSSDLPERIDGVTDLQAEIDAGKLFIRYIGDNSSSVIPSMATIFIKNMKGAELTFTLGVGASVIQYMPDGTVTETRNVNTIVLPESHSSATMSTSQIELKNDFIDYGSYLKITGESFDSIQLKRGDYTIDSSCVGTFPDPFHKDGKLTVDIISNSVGSQTFKSNYGATFQRRWRIISGQPSFNVWICTSFGTILQQSNYPTAGQNFRNYTTQGSFRFNDTSPINSPLGSTIPAIGELTVKAATSSGLIYQQFTYKHLLTPMAFECIYNGTTWTNWIPVSPDVIYYPSPLVNEAFSFNAINYHVNIRVNTGSATPSDGPFGAPCFGRLKVETDYLNYVFQEFKEMGGTNRIAVRSSSNNGSTWTAWRIV